MLKYNGLIPANRAAILFRTDKPNYEKIVDLEVCDWNWDTITPKVKKYYEEKYPSSLGTFCANWVDGTIADKLTRFIQIFADYPDTEKDIIQKCIFEFGKIEEFPGLRRLYYNKYDRTNDYFNMFLENKYLVKPNEN